MNSLLLPWTARGLKYDSRQYLTSLNEDLQKPTEAHVEKPSNQSKSQVDPDMLFTDAIPILVKMRGTSKAGVIEYGCFNLDGTLIEDFGKRFARQRRNILYYMISGMFNLSRGGNQFGSGASVGADPVSASPASNWAVILTEACPYINEIKHALDPLINHRSGKIITIPKLESNDQSRIWVEEQFTKHSLPNYLLICDSFQNIPIEYQFILNAFAVTGRLWFDRPEDFETYTKKVIDVERGNFDTGRRYTIASPVDDKVTQVDDKNIIQPMLKEMESNFSFKPLLGTDFNKESLLDAAKSSRFLALYCHGIGSRKKDFERSPSLQGAFVLEFKSKYNEGLLTPDDISDVPFVPGGIIFSPACLAGGTQADSDFAHWIQQDSLAPYLGQETYVSSISRTMLSSLKGPVAALLHFDISMGSSAPMYNRLTQHNMQAMLHMSFVLKLLKGQMLGKATNRFRWAAGDNYARAIHIFGVLTGKIPSFTESSGVKTVRQFVRSMNIHHVTATDMRNYIILGDPAVSLTR